MFDILDEVQYIKDILANGFGENWKVDAGIYVRFCKEEGLNKADSHKKMVEKFSKMGGYNEDTYYKEMDRVFNSNWKKSEPLRTIKYITLSQEILDWFYNNKELTMREKKVLFTFYGWSKINEWVYPKGCLVHDLSKSLLKFKEEASIKNTGNVKRKEFTTLLDKKYLVIYKTIKKDPKDPKRKIPVMKYKCVFMEQEPFSSVNFSENKIRIDGEENLHKFGEYIESYLTNREKTEKYGTFICKNCQGKFIHYNASIKEKSRIYCKECAKELELEDYTGVVKSVVCQDCGKEVVVLVKDNSTCRCGECQESFRRKYKTEKQREYDRM